MGKKQDKTDRPGPYPDPSQPPRQSIRQAIITSRQEMDNTQSASDTMNIMNNPDTLVMEHLTVDPQDLAQASTSEQTTSVSGSLQSNNQNILSNDPCIPSITEFREMQTNMAVMSTTLAKIQQSLERSNPPVNSNIASAHVPNVTNVTNGLQNNISTGATPLVNTTGVISASEHAVNAALNQHVDGIIDDVITGETGNFAQVGRPVDMKVPDSLKHKIWNDQYIDLSLLLDDTPPSMLTPSPLEVVSGQGEPLRVAPSKSPKTINNLGMWCDAFLVYLTVYTRKYPSATPQLTSYIKLIKTLCQRGGNYLLYDREFRYLRQANGLGWDLHSTLWLECRDPANKTSVPKPGNNKKQNFRPSGAGNPKSHPSGTCFQYHNTGVCHKPHCQFTHKCYTTGCNTAFAHPIFKCPKRTNTQNTRTPHTITVAAANTN